MTAAPAALPMQMAPEPAAQSAPEIASPRAQVSNALQALETANFAFNAPATLELNSTAQIQLRLSLAESIEQLKAELTAEGERVGDVVKVSDRVEARLSGMNFEINAITEPTQPLGVNDTLEWSWDVKPVEEGEQKLHLTLTALMSVNGKDIGRTVRTLDKTIVVQVSAVNRASLLFGKYWQWLMTAVFIPLFGWGVKKLRGRTAAQPAAAHSL